MSSSMKHLLNIGLDIDDISKPSSSKRARYNQPSSYKSYTFTSLPDDIIIHIFSHLFTNTLINHEESVSMAPEYRDLVSLSKCNTRLHNLFETFKNIFNLKNIPKLDDDPRILCNGQTCNSSTVQWWTLAKLRALQHDRIDTIILDMDGTLCEHMIRDVFVETLNRVLLKRNSKIKNFSCRDSPYLNLSQWFENNHFQLLTSLIICQPLRKTIHSLQYRLSFIRYIKLDDIDINFKSEISNYLHSASLNHLSKFELTFTNMHHEYFIGHQLYYFCKNSLDSQNQNVKTYGNDISRLAYRLLLLDVSKINLRSIKESMNDRKSGNSFCSTCDLCDLNKFHKVKRAKYRKSNVETPNVTGQVDLLIEGDMYRNSSGKISMIKKLSLAIDPDKKLIFESPYASGLVCNYESEKRLKIMSMNMTQLFDFDESLHPYHNRKDINFIQRSGMKALDINRQVNYKNGNVDFLLDGNVSLPYWFLELCKYFDSVIIDEDFDHSYSLPLVSITLNLMPALVNLKYVSVGCNWLSCLRSCTLRKVSNPLYRFISSLEKCEVFHVHDILLGVENLTPIYPTDTLNTPKYRQESYEEFVKCLYLVLNHLNVTSKQLRGVYVHTGRIHIENNYVRYTGAYKADISSCWRELDVMRQRRGFPDIDVDSVTSVLSTLDVYR